MHQGYRVEDLLKSVIFKPLWILLRLFSAFLLVAENSAFAITGINDISRYLSDIFNRKLFKLYNSSQYSVFYCVIN